MTTAVPGHMVATPLESVDRVIHFIGTTETQIYLSPIHSKIRTFSISTKPLGIWICEEAPAPRMPRKPDALPLLGIGRFPGWVDEEDGERDEIKLTTSRARRPREGDGACH